MCSSPHFHHGLLGPVPTKALIHLHHDGEPGDIITTGFVFNTQTGYSTSINMTDPGTAASNKIAGAHFRFGQPNPGDGFPTGTSFEAPLLVANTGDQPTNVQIHVDVTAGGQPNRVSVDESLMNPGDVRLVRLDEELDALGIYGPVDSSGVEVTWTGRPGDIIGQLTSVDASGDFAFEVPIKDPSGINETIGGSYPWSLENGTHTILHLKNASEERTYAMIQITFPNGDTYNPDRVFLEPFQAISIDIGEMKTDNQQDIRDQFFPQTVERGVLIWIAERPYTMIGRAERINISAGIASSFSCGYGCECASNPWSSFMSPSSADLLKGTSAAPFTPKEYRQTCGGKGIIVGPYTVLYIDSWSSSNSSIASVNSSGTVTGNSFGTSTITAGWDDWTEYYDEFWEECVDFYDPQSTSAQSRVRDPQWVQRLGPGTTTLGLCLPTPAVQLSRTFGFYDNYGRIFSSLSYHLAESFTSAEHCDVSLDVPSIGYQIMDDVKTCQRNCTTTVRQKFKAAVPGSPLAPIQVKNCPSCPLHNGYDLTINKESVTATDY